MKTYFTSLIKNKQEQEQNIRSQVEASTDVNEVRSLTKQMTALQAEIREAQAQLEKLEKEERQQVPDTGALNPLESYGMDSRKSDSENIELRKRLAFANFVTRDVKIPVELRDATTTSDTTAVIPVQLATEIIEQLEAIGMILPLVTKTSYPTGQIVPVDSVKPVATWAGEGKGSNQQKKSKLGSITFGGYKLRCEIAVTQEVSVQTLPSFEKLFIKQVSEAMVKAIESKILSDTDGSAGTPSGIFYNMNESTNPDKVVEINVGESGLPNYATLCMMEAELPQQYESNAKWFMTKKTFMMFQSMTDSNGQPIARIDHDMTGKPERVLLGREVVLCGDYMESLKKTVTQDTVVACLFDMSDYVLNTSYDLGIQSKIDWDNEDHKTKAVMSVDGKVVDRGSLVKLVQKATSSTK
ncbi:MAG: phage major capsid protein [Oscillospiraceae bacterium]|nr:phage major capsid protein [Oscillospiraceae bacterium]